MLIPTAQGWWSLAVLLDLFARRVIGWAMSWLLYWLRNVSMGCQT
jgi:transposase InsO family protein